MLKAAPLEKNHGSIELKLAIKAGSGVVPHGRPFVMQAHACRATRGVAFAHNNALF
jgi:hypothetical protein